MVLISPLSRALVAMRAFPRVRLYQALSVPGVESVSAAYAAGSAVWKNVETGWSRDILMIGIDPEQDVLDIPEVRQRLTAQRIRPVQPAELIDLGLVRLRPGADPDAVRAAWTP